MQFVTAEEHQLKDKETELTRIEATLAQKELDLVTLMGELRTFEAVYLRVIDSRYARLDEINAQFAEAYAGLNPGDDKALARAAIVLIDYRYHRYYR